MTFLQLLKPLVLGMALLSLNACGLVMKEPRSATSTASPAETNNGSVTEADTLTEGDEPERCQLDPNLSISEELLATLTLPDTHNLNLIEPSTPQFHKNLGVGYLGPLFDGELRLEKESRPIRFNTFDWIEEVILPLYSSPNGPLLGWMACGQLISGASSPKPLNPWVFYPGYSGYGFIILDAVNVEEEEGWLESEQWLQLRYAEPNAEDDGVAWISAEQLDFGTMKLGFISWTQYFQHMIDSDREYADSDQWNDVGTLYFRYGTGDHAVRVEPSEQAAAIAWVEDADSMRPLLIQEDWMYVRLYRPSNFCVMDTWQGTVQEGWVHWITPEHGNELGEPYKGC